jgi:hypothetical protein
LLGYRELSKSSFFVFFFCNKKANFVQRMVKRVKSVVMSALKNKDDDEPTNTGTGWFVAKEESESYIMTNYHLIFAIMQRSNLASQKDPGLRGWQRRRQTQHEIKVHILIRAALYHLCIIVSSFFQVPDVAMVEDSSNFRRPNEISSEASSSGNCLVTVRL